LFVGVEFDAVVYFAAEYGFPINVLGRQVLVDDDGRQLVSEGRCEHEDATLGTFVANARRILLTMRPYSYIVIKLIVDRRCPGLGQRMECQAFAQGGR
jgi:hypothetical protein